MIGVFYVMARGKGAPKSWDV